VRLKKRVSLGYRKRGHLWKKRGTKKSLVTIRQGSEKIERTGGKPPPKSASASKKNKQPSLFSNKKSNSKKGKAS